MDVRERRGRQDDSEGFGLSSCERGIASHGDFGSEVQSLSFLNVANDFL